MKIERDEARRIAALARIEMAPEEVERMAAEMTKILGYIDQLKEIDATEAPPQPDLAPALRGDEPRTPGRPREVEANAPEWRDGFFVVPRVIGE
jgi:aspartyl-tRNA(Asn)/glutamyl-tRNA(Gln) amidotransferase subunit C